MNFKRNIGAMLLMVTAIVMNSGTVSYIFVGTEEIPESMKNLR